VSERHIPDRGFAGDDGSADPGLAAALTTYAAARDAVPVLRALREARLLVPVVAVLGEVEIDERGLAHDKISDMATVLLTGADGRQALLAFTSLETLTAWRPDARPVPVSAVDAAKAAVSEGAAALLVDVAGPVMFAVEGADLEPLAAGWRLGTVGERAGWVGPVDSPPAE